jgi:hypothetical protein
MGKEKEKKNLVLVDALTDVLGRSEDQSLEEVKEELHEEGVDVEATLRGLLTFREEVSRAARRERLEAARERRQQMDVARSGLMGRFRDWTKERAISRIQEIIASQRMAPTVSYRDLESQSKEDLISLLEDLEIASQVENHDQDQEGR